MTMTPEEELATWKEIAVAESLRADEAVSLLGAAVEHIKAAPSAPAAPAPKPAAPPPAPAPPPPPWPESMSAFLALAPRERARVKAAHGGEKLEEELHAQFLRENTMRNLRGGHSAHVTGPAGGVHLGASPGVDDYYVGAPQAIPRGTPSRADLEAAALAQRISPAPARPAVPAPARPAPTGKPQVGQKTRALPHFSR